MRRRSRSPRIRPSMRTPVRLRDVTGSAAGSCPFMQSCRCVPGGQHGVSIRSSPGGDRVAVPSQHVHLADILVSGQPAARASGFLHRPLFVRIPFEHESLSRSWQHEVGRIAATVAEDMTVVGPEPSRRRRCRAPSARRQRGSGRRRTVIVVDKGGNRNDTPRHRLGAGHVGGTAQVRTRRSRGAPPLLARSNAPPPVGRSSRRRRERSGRRAQSSRPPRAAPGYSDGVVFRYVLLAPRTMKCFIPKIAASRLRSRSGVTAPPNLHLEKPRDEPATGARHNPQRRLVRRRLRAVR